jgi:hypothetical protein
VSGDGRQSSSPGTEFSIFRQPRAKDGEVLYLNSELQRKSVARASRPSIVSSTHIAAASALRIDFVVKPENTADVASGIRALIEQAGLHQEGLQSSVFLVSDREARVATLLTFWDGQRFSSAKERLTSWTLKLVAHFADGPVRTSTGVANIFASLDTPQFPPHAARPNEFVPLPEFAAAG